MEYVFETHHRNVPESDLLNDLMTVADRLGKTPTISEYNASGQFHAATFARRFGCWTNAIVKAGLPPTRSPINIPEADLFDNIEAVWDSIGHQPRYSDLDGPHSKISAKTYANRFGSLTAALEAFRLHIGNQSEPIPIRYSTNVSPSRVNYRMRYAVLKRDQFRCTACGAAPATNPGVQLHIDHVTPRSRGGDNTMENLTTLCEPCNLGKSNIV